jgi:Metal binding domain of Ada
LPCNTLRFAMSPECGHSNDRVGLRPECKLRAKGPQRGTSGVFCRPSRGSRLPCRNNVVFYTSRRRAFGFRPCTLACRRHAELNSSAPPRGCARPNPFRPTALTRMSDAPIVHCRHFRQQRPRDASSLRPGPFRLPIPLARTCLGKEANRSNPGSGLHQRPVLRWPGPAPNRRLSRKGVAQRDRFRRLVRQRPSAQRPKLAQVARRLPGSPNLRPQAQSYASRSFALTRERMRLTMKAP